MCNFLNILHKLHREKTNWKNSVAYIHWFNFCGVTIKKADACKATETHEVSYPISSCHFVFPDLISMTNDFISTQNFSSVALNWIVSVSVCNTGASPSITSKESLGMKGAREVDSPSSSIFPQIYSDSLEPSYLNSVKNLINSHSAGNCAAISQFACSISSPRFLLKVEG